MTNAHHGTAHSDPGYSLYGDVAFASTVLYLILVHGHGLFKRANTRLRSRRRAGLGLLNAPRPSFGSGVY